MAWRFNTPPGWPPPPSEDWLPPLGWQPDPTWPVPPDGWIHYLPMSDDGKTGWRPGPVASVLGVLGLLDAGFWGVISMFLVFTTDSCGLTTATCDELLAYRAWLGTWAAEAVILLAAVALCTDAVRRIVGERSLRWRGELLTAYLLVVVGIPAVVIAGNIVAASAV